LRLSDEENFENLQGGGGKKEKGKMGGRLNSPRLWSASLADLKPLGIQGWQSKGGERLYAQKRRREPTAEKNRGSSSVSPEEGEREKKVIACTTLAATHVSPRTRKKRGYQRKVKTQLKLRKTQGKRRSE